MAKRFAVKTNPDGYTPRLGSLDSAITHAIVMSKEWDQPVALYRGKRSDLWFGMIEQIVGAMDEASLVCWIDAPDRRKL